MRDYQIDGLPHRPTIRVEPISPERLPRIAEKGLELMRVKGYDPNDPGHVKHHLLGDGTKPPRVVALLAASLAIVERRFDGFLQQGTASTSRAGCSTCRTTLSSRCSASASFGRTRPGCIGRLAGRRGVPEPLDECVKLKADGDNCL